MADAEIQIGALNARITCCSPSTHNTGASRLSPSYVCGAFEVKRLQCPYAHRVPWAEASQAGQTGEGPPRQRGSRGPRADTAPPRKRSRQSFRLPSLRDPEVVVMRYVPAQQWGIARFPVARARRYADRHGNTDVWQASPERLPRPADQSRRVILSATGDTHPSLRWELIKDRMVPAKASYRWAPTSLRALADK